ncbi:bifunctional riboflavin kinase/FAD synthetase [Peribacillus acanthi]|uniref:bifunctional riboflavin kinase/FAD synthetase n=1 Tax=Peribacillus acanthi TaxID=2171554 RepID=UPI000D3E9301|nr:bifunctional riboflavin kinase/FAD synthetase [Peribacillus acanthi]
MKVIHINHPHSFHREDFPPLVIALGFFDGVHLGHQKVIKTAMEIAKDKNYKSAVITFDPHPLSVLRKQDKVHYITPVEEKIKRIGELGVDYIFIVHFTEAFANLHPQEFVDQYLINLNANHVVAGFDYSYGHLGKGNMESLPFHSRELFSSTIVEKMSKDDQKVSSTRIRQSLLEGKMEDFLTLAGRFYQSKGKVIHGEKRGRQLGFPTANVAVDQDYIIPSTGVYAVRVNVCSKWYYGVCNIGYKPTFHNQKPENPTIEVHILDFSSTIYEEQVIIEWHRRLRSEKKFDGLDQLVAQIQKDKDSAIEYFQSLSQD